MPLCMQKGATLSFARLGRNLYFKFTLAVRCVALRAHKKRHISSNLNFCVAASVPVDVCEICAFAACTGC